MYAHFLTLKWQKYIKMSVVWLHNLCAHFHAHAAFALEKCCYVRYLFSLLAYNAKIWLYYGK